MHLFLVAALGGLSGPAMWLQHGLVFVLVVVMPLWDRYEIPRLKASSEPRKKILYYGKIVAALWVCTGVAVVTVGLATVWAAHKVPGEISWLDAGSRGATFLEGLTFGIMVMLLLPALLALRSERIRTKSAKAAKRLSFLLPSTAEERKWWWLVSLSAGICEEIVYRGFLLHYLHGMPFHLTWTWALVVGAVIFGIGHLYQGIAGAVQTAVIGFVFGALFLVTGTLLVPMILHAVMDLRALALLPEGFAQAGEPASV